VDVFYTVAEEHAWQLSSAFPKIGHENVCLDFLRGRRPLDFGWMVFFNEAKLGFHEQQRRHLGLSPIQLRKYKSVEKVSLSRLVDLVRHGWYFADDDLHFGTIFQDLFQTHTHTREKTDYSVAGEGVIKRAASGPFGRYNRELKTK